MLQIDKQSRIPVYEQVVEKLEKLVLTNILQANEQLPSVRTWSAELGINPNTLQKAYLYLDTKGITYSVPGVGRFISETAKSVIESNKGKQLGELYEITANLALAGILKEKVYETIDDAYAHVEQNKLNIKKGNKI
jgi:GntR family transcriptional regulator